MIRHHRDTKPGPDKTSNAKQRGAFTILVKYARNSIRLVAQKAFPPLATIGKLISIAISNRSHLKNKGYFKSAKAGIPVDRNGNPIPWMNYPIVDLFKERFSNKLTMFEYGSGNSTLFYSKMLKHVTSLEGNISWYNQLKSKLPSNVALILVDASKKDSYLNAIRQTDKKYNIIMVDAEYRNDCAEQAIHALTPDGVIIYDDSHRLAPDNPIFSTLKQQGFRELTFRGLKPGSFSEYASTIFYRSDNCLGL